MTNIELAVKVVKELVQTGVEEFILCAGARNSPFVQVFAENPHLDVYHFFEERSAAFFALGRMARSRRPVAIFTTSGTAAAELLPAAVEGAYSSIPLIMVTADRPKSYRGSGAPQSIEQVGMFSYYIEVALDVDAENSHLSFKNLSWKKPIQVNVSFDEPLLDGPVPHIEKPAHSEWTKMPEQVAMNTLDDVQDFLSKYRPVIVVGFVPERAHGTLLDFLKQYKAPVYLEGISSLRGHPALKEIEITSGEKMVGHLIEQGHCNALLRLGGVPTLRIWRDLESKLVDLPVLSLSYNHFTGLSRPTQHFTFMEALAQVEVAPNLSLPQTALVTDRAQALHLKELFAKYPQAEPSLVHSLSQKLAGMSVYLGNSLPIREWDLAADRQYPPRRVVGNRGANGIDGQISSFIGWSDADCENWALVGDLTAMYDLSAPWIVSQLDPKLKLRLVVINNQGGQIFKRMFKHPIYLNEHQIHFEHFAKMWNWDYQLWSDVPKELSVADKVVIELVPDAKQTDSFWQEWENLWKK